jgi:type I restriction enzyme S subunit
VNNINGSVSGWKVYKYGDLFLDIKSGISRRLENNDIGYPVVRSSNILNERLDLSDLKYWYKKDPKGVNLENYVLQDGDILINFINSIAQIGKCCIFKGQNREFIYTTNIFRLKPNQSLFGEYFYYYTQTKRYILDIQNITKPAVNQASFTKSDFENLEILLPPLKEQQKIADILSSVDAAIEKTEQVIAKTEEVKKGLMQQLLTKGIGHTKFKQTDIGNIPIKWKLLTLESLCERVTRKNKSLNDNVLTISAQHGLINQAEFFNKIVAGKNIESYYLLKQGEFAYNKSYSKGYPFGVIRRLDRYEEGILSTLYICFKLKDEQTVTSDFINNIFESGLLDSQFVGIAKEGARAHGLLNIKVADFFNIQIPIPSLEEQNKISEVIKVMNIRIDSEEIKLKKLNEVKKGLMQQLLTGKTRVKID